MTGMGRIVPAMDHTALAEAIIEVLDHPERYEGDVQEVIKRFSPQQVAEEYEQLFKSLLGNQVNMV
jgi:glycosyltransferase involved in cell wall biosynthesis